MLTHTHITIGSVLASALLCTTAPMAMASNYTIVGGGIGSSGVMSNNLSGEGYQMVDANDNGRDFAVNTAPEDSGDSVTNDGGSGGSSGGSSGGGGGSSGGGGSRGGSGRGDSHATVPTSHGAAPEVTAETNTEPIAVVRRTNLDTGDASTYTITPESVREIYTAPSVARAPFYNVSDFRAALTALQGSSVTHQDTHSNGERFVGSASHFAIIDNISTVNPHQLIGFLVDSQNQFVREQRHYNLMTVILSNTVLLGFSLIGLWYRDRQWMLQQQLPNKRSASKRSRKMQVSASFTKKAV